MKSILCYGDSNTYGYDPNTGGARFSRDVRWTGVLQKELGRKYDVIEEGLNGRTTVWDDPIEEYRNGKKYLIPCLESHKPLDLVIIMLGTNDLKQRYSLPVYDIACGMETLIKTINTSGCFNGQSQILLLSPVPVGEMRDEFAQIFGDAMQRSIDLVAHYRKLAEKLNIHFFEAGSVVKISSSDRLHYDKIGHQMLGKALSDVVKAILDIEESSCY